MSSYELKLAKERNKRLINRESQKEYNVIYNNIKYFRFQRELFKC